MTHLRYAVRQSLDVLGYLAFILTIGWLILHGYSHILLIAALMFTPAGILAFALCRAAAKTPSNRRRGDA